MRIKVFRVNSECTELLTLWQVMVLGGDARGIKGNFLKFILVCIGLPGADLSRCGLLYLIYIIHYG